VVLHRDEQNWSSQMLDICFKGVLVEQPEDFLAKLGDRYKIDVIFANNKVTIYADVSVVHAENNHVGFKVDQIDLDSISHLRRLVELNLGSSELLERELAHLIQSASVQIF